ncbi:MAG: putative collagen-binding domain-containing protein, partial [Anaerolineae bacterium]
PGLGRICYVPAEACGVLHRAQRVVRDLEAGVRYRASYFDPKRGDEHEIGIVSGDAASCWAPPKPPIFQDWVLVLENSGADL